MNVAQSMVLGLLVSRARWVSPTEIGNQLHRGRGSAWASPKCKALVRMGLAERSEYGHYRATVRAPTPCAKCPHIAHVYAMLRMVAMKAREA